MLTIRCCSAPKSAEGRPKRVGRRRPVKGSKHVNLFNELKKTIKDDQGFVDSFFKKTEDMWDELKAARDDEEEAENAD